MLIFTCETSHSETREVCEISYVPKFSHVKSISHSSPSHGCLQWLVKKNAHLALCQLCNLLREYSLSNVGFMSHLLKKANINKRECEPFFIYI